MKSGPMVKKISLMLVLMFAILAVSTPAYAAYVTTTELIENARDFDGREVSFKGEAIGEAMARGDYAWINVSDGSNTMGVWVDRAQAENIDIFGNYKHKGDVVIIYGVFNRACTEHGGDMDIHATDLEVLYPGHEVQSPISKYKLMLAFFLISLTAVLWLVQDKRGGKSSE